MIKRTGVFWIVLAGVSVLLWQVVKSGKSRPETNINFTEFMREVENGKIKSVSIRNGIDVRGSYKDNSPELRTLIPANYVEIYKILRDSGVEIEIEQSGGGWVSVLINASPFLLLLAFWVFMMRQMQNRRPPPAAV